MRPNVIKSNTAASKFYNHRGDITYPIEKSKQFLLLKYAKEVASSADPAWRGDWLNILQEWNARWFYCSVVDEGFVSLNKQNFLMYNSS